MIWGYEFLRIKDIFYCVKVIRIYGWGGRIEAWNIEVIIKTCFHEKAKGYIIDGRLFCYIYHYRMLICLVKRSTLNHKSVLLYFIKLILLL